MQRYYAEMAMRNRLVRWTDEDGHCLGHCGFFILPSIQHVSHYYYRPLWSTPADASEGPVVYLDKLWAATWTRQHRTLLEEWLNQQIPSWELAVWYRPRTHQDVAYHWRRADAAHLAD